jgi:tetratricopeptide (TPR) repeat protein
MNCWGFVMAAESGSKSPAKTVLESRQVDMEIEEGSKLEQNKQYREALLAYRKVAEAYKGTTNFSRVQVKIGNVLLRQGKSVDARNEYMKILSNNSGKDKAFGIKAVEGIFFSYLQENEFQKAESYYADAMGKLGYTKKEAGIFVAQKQAIAKKWKKDSVEKIQITRLLEKYNEAIVHKNISAFNGVFVAAIAETRINNLKVYFAKYPSETRTIRDIEIDVAESGNTAMAEFQIDIVRTVGESKAFQSRDGFLKFKKTNGIWQVAE